LKGSSTKGTTIWIKKENYRNLLIIKTNMEIEDCKTYSFDNVIERMIKERKEKKQK
jgi:hypothetical protein